MKSNKKLLDTLNDLLADELAAISEYTVHSEMCKEWGYKKLHKAFKHQSKDEMHHAKWPINRILFLEGAPLASKPPVLKICQTLPDMLEGSEKEELAAVGAYNKGLRLARESNDEVTADLLLRILRMEEDHMDWAERQRSQIAQMGLQHYLSRQTKGATY